MTSLANVPRFTIKNKVHYPPSGNESDADLNRLSWRYLYDRTDDVDNVPDPQNSTTQQDYNTQLPWLTLYKTHKDLLQIRLVTTIGYEDGVAKFIKGFPLMLQGPDSQFEDKDQIPTTAWEYNWPSYKSYVEDFSGNLNTSIGINGWQNTNGGKVITDMVNKKNLIILDLDHSEFVLKNNSKSQVRFTNTPQDSDIKDNYNGKSRPPYLVVRIDSAIEETSFAYYNNNNELQSVGDVRVNPNYSGGGGTKTLKVFNYVYKGYVISPYDVMSRFTTDYLRAILVINNSLSSGFINKNRNTLNSPNAIQINSKFFSSTHNIKDGWDNSRKNTHERLKAPYYYNFFIKPTPLAVKDISENDQPSERFDCMIYNLESLYPEKGAANVYYIEKLFWSSLTTPRHTQYSGSSSANGKRFYLGNYLNVNEVDASYNTQNNTRVFLNSNTDYMPVGPYSDGTINGPQTLYTPGTVNINGFTLSGSGTQSEPWGGNSTNIAENTTDSITFYSGVSGTFYIKSSVSSESGDEAHIEVNIASYQNNPVIWQQDGVNDFNNGNWMSFSVVDQDSIKFKYVKDGTGGIITSDDRQTYQIYFVGDPDPTSIPQVYNASSFKASGYIERYQSPEEDDGQGNIEPGKFIGKSEINMARKTITPYYFPNTLDSASYNKYAFFYPDGDNWTQYNGVGQTPQYYIQTTTEKIDIDNCTVLEFRNLVEFNSDTRINIDFTLNNTGQTFEDSGKKTVTFLDSGKSITSGGNEVYRTLPKYTYNNSEIIVKNNNVFTLETGDPNRRVDKIDAEKFRIKWDSSNDAIAKKNIFVIDIATGSYEVEESSIDITVETLNSGTIDPFLPSSWNDHKSLFNFKANVYQIKINQSDTNGDIQRENGEFLNFSLDGVPQQVSIYNEPRIYAAANTNNVTASEGARPLFGYLNFYGLTSSEFIGGVDWHKGQGTNNMGDQIGNCNFWLKTVFSDITSDFRNRLNDNPYYLLTETNKWENDYTDASLIYFNSNIFYGATNFAFSNIFATTSLIGESYNKTDVLFIGKTTGPTSPEWRNSLYNTHGLDITSLSQNKIENAVTNKRFFIDKTGVELFNGTIFGKFDINNRTFDGTTSNNTEPSCIELNDGLIAVDSTNSSNTLKLECLNFYKVAFVAGQKNLFISDYWEWKDRLVSLTIPQEKYTGIIPVNLDITDRTLNNRYNIYDWKATNIPSTLYPTTKVHNPQRAYENQSLINFSVEVSTISFNVSHILINTWAGNMDNNNNLDSEAIVGLSSFANVQGTYDIINGSPILNIDGGLSVTPDISSNPVYLNINTHGQLNFATDTTLGTISDDEKSKAPSEIPEVEGGNPISFNPDIFGLVNGGAGPPDGGWFTHLRPQTNQGINKQLGRNGIFVPMADGTGSNPSERFYSTRDFTANALSITPTNITLNTTTYPGDGGFRSENQKFPLELLFCYPFNVPDNIQKPNKLTTTYNNSDQKTTYAKFDNFKGYKRFSKLYAIKIKGDSIDDTNTNFRDRAIFPETILVNCVELPPPKQVNNFNDMLADDNTFVKLVWKGYNFDYSVGNARSQLGNVGNIKWKIERFQTQLEIRKTIFNDYIEPDGGNSESGFNLSTYTYIDKDIRIYDKYTYTVTGTFIYNFLRTSEDINIYTLEMPFGSFTTDELIVCKNNKFEYGRYNTTSTNLKLFRPLLINKDGGQVDKFNKPSAGGLCLGNIFSGSTRISSSQNIYANTTNQLTKKQTYVLLAKQGSISGFR